MPIKTALSSRILIYTRYGPCSIAGKPQNILPMTCDTYRIAAFDISKFWYKVIIFLFFSLLSISKSHL